MRANEDRGVDRERAARPEGVCSPLVTTEQHSNPPFTEGIVGQIFSIERIISSPRCAIILRSERFIKLFKCHLAFIFPHENLR